MKLTAVLLRVEGVFADVAGVRREACNRVFDEAGFSWRLDARENVEVFRNGSASQALSGYVLGRLGSQSSGADTERLADAMGRRYSAVFADLLQSGVCALKPGVREVLVAGPAAGVRFALIARLKRSECEALLRAALGAEFADLFPGGIHIDGGDDLAAAESTFKAALAALSVEPEHCVVIESRPLAVTAARGLGLKVLPMGIDEDAAGHAEGVSSLAPNLRALVRQRLQVKTLWLDKEIGMEILSELERWHEHGDIAHSQEGSTTMQVQDILKTKGADVKSVRPGDRVQTLTRRLAEDKVGALVVLSETGKLEGIVSERDIARGLATYGCDLLEMPVTEIMTKVVITCSPADSLYGVAKVMTTRRIRHVPVSENGRLVGLVSIGDVLNHRLEELQLEANVLRDYAIALR
ncbi:MAG: CBS domain-containing protein [Hyphomicrobium sp.]